MHIGRHLTCTAAWTGNGRFPFWPGGIGEPKHRRLPLGSAGAFEPQAAAGNERENREKNPSPTASSLTEAWRRPNRHAGLRISDASCPGRSSRLIQDTWGSTKILNEFINKVPGVHNESDDRYIKALDFGFHKYSFLREDESGAAVTSTACASGRPCTRLIKQRMSISEYLRAYHMGDAHKGSGLLPVVLLLTIGSSGAGEFLLSIIPLILGPLHCWKRNRGLLPCKRGDSQEWRALRDCPRLSRSAGECPKYRQDGHCYNPLATGHTIMETSGEMNKGH